MQAAGGGEQFAGEPIPTLDEVLSGLGWSNPLSDRAQRGRHRKPTLPEPFDDAGVTGQRDDAELRCEVCGSYSGSDARNPGRRALQGARPAGPDILARRVISAAPPQMPRSAAINYAQ